MIQLVQFLSLWEKMEEWADSFREWIQKNYANPLLWIGILVFAFVLFRSLYSTLNKGD